MRINPMQRKQIPKTLNQRRIIKSVETGNNKQSLNRQFSIPYLLSKPKQVKTIGTQKLMTNNDCSLNSKRSLSKQSLRLRNHSQNSKITLQILKPQSKQKSVNQQARKQCSQHFPRKQPSIAILKDKSSIQSSKFKIKTTLKIQKIQDFKSIIPCQGFIQVKQKLSEYQKGEQLVIISNNGILKKQEKGWEFRDLKNYQYYIKRIKRLLQIDLFKYFYKFQVFGKWKRLFTKKRMEKTLKHLSKLLPFSSNNILMVLKQQQILCKSEQRNSFFQMSSNSQHIQITQCSNYLFKSVLPKLQDLKVNSFQQFLMTLLINLRTTIQQKQQFNLYIKSFKLNDTQFQDFLTRKHIQDHQIILLKFIYRYQEVKLQTLISVLEEIKSKIRYNIQKWGEKFNDKLTILDAIKIEFGQVISEDFDSSCFSHEIKIKQIVIPIIPNQTSSQSSFLAIGANIIPLLLEQIKNYFRERYQTNYSCGSQLWQLSQRLLKSQIISQRELKILQKCLSTVDTYCFAQCLKSIQEDVDMIANQIGEIFQNNVDIAMKSAELIQKSFVKLSDGMFHTQISYKHEYYNGIELLRQKISRLPQKIQVGLCILNLQQSISHYQKMIAFNESIIINSCLGAFVERASSVDFALDGYDQQITVSCWIIKEFIRSYQGSQSYSLYFQGLFPETIRELESVLQTIHRVQPRYYEQYYLRLFQLKERGEVIRSKALCFLREVYYKLSYLMSERDKRTQSVHQRLQAVESQLMELAAQDNIAFNVALQGVTAINDKVIAEGKEIQQLTAFLDIERAHTHKEGRQEQFLSFDKLKHQAGFLLKLLISYRQLSQLMENQLQRQYNSFRLELLVDCIHNQIAKIKQSTRFLHHYQKFLVNISSYYQSQNQKIRLLRLTMQLDTQDLVKIDKKKFIAQQRYSALQLLQYIASESRNQYTIKLFIEEKEYTNRVKEKILSIQQKIVKFIIVNTNEFQRPIHPELNNFLQILQRNQAQFQGFLKNQHLKELRSQMYEFLALLRKSIKFLAQYRCLYELYTTYQSYLKKSQHSQRVINKFLDLFREESRELTQISQKWWELNVGLRESSLKTLIDLKYEWLMERLGHLQNIIRIQISKINQYLSKRVQQFPLFNILSIQKLINVVNQPQLFLQYIHPSVSHLHWQHFETVQQTRNNLIVRTIYDEKVTIPLQAGQQGRQKAKIRGKAFKLQLQSCMSEITNSIRRGIIMLSSPQCQNYLQTCFSQKLPLQIIQVSDQINNWRNLQNHHNPIETIKNIDKSINSILSFKENSELTKYQILLIEALILSKLQSKHRFNAINMNELISQLTYRIHGDQIYLQIFNQSIRLQCQLVDSTDFSVIQPINQRCFLKLYQTVTQSRSAVLFGSEGLQSLAARTMRLLFIVTQQKTPIEKALQLLSKEPVFCFYNSPTNQDASQFYQRMIRAYSLITSTLYEKDRKVKSKQGSTKTLGNYKPILYLQCPLSMSNFRQFHKEISAELRHTFRVVELQQPSLGILLHSYILRQSMLIQSQSQVLILQKLYAELALRGVVNLGYKSSAKILSKVCQGLSLFQNIESQTIDIAFKIARSQMTFEQINGKVERKQTVIFRNRGLRSKQGQSIIRWEETKLSSQFVRFSRSMDEALEQQGGILIVGSSGCGKSHMIKLYCQMLNLQNRSEKDKGHLSTRPLRLQSLDVSLANLDPLHLQNQIRALVRLPPDEQDPLWLFWMQGFEKFTPRRQQQLLDRDLWLSFNHLDSRVVLELSKLSDLSPNLIVGRRYVLVRQQSFSVQQVIHAHQQEILYMLSGNILHKSHEIFFIFQKVFNTFFQPSQRFGKMLIVNCGPEIIAIHTFQLVAGIIRYKSPKVVQYLQGLKESDRAQVLRKLFAHCFLWVTGSLVQQGMLKKYEEGFLEACRAEQIDTSSIGNGFVLNFQSDILEYLPIKSAKASLLKAQQPILTGQNHIFIQTPQSIILKHLLLYLTCNSYSRIVLFGQSQTGKTALLQHFASSSTQNYRHFYYICSLYTYNCLKEFNKSLRQMNSIYQREKVQLMLKQEKSRQLKWYMSLAKTKCVFVENIALQLEKPTLAYFKYITSFQRIFVDGEVFEFRNLHLLLQRGKIREESAEDRHFLHVRLHYQQSYFSQVFYGIYEIIGKNCSATHETCYDILKLKGAIVKNLLVLMKAITRRIKHSLKNWTYYYHLCTLKHALQQLRTKIFRSKGDFLEGLFLQLQFALYRRLRQQSSKQTLNKLLQNCKIKIKEDLREDFLLQETSYLFIRQQEIVVKLTNYLQYKNQFKNLKKSHSLVSNLTHFFQALSKTPLLILNKTYIPAVGPFLPVAAQILGLQLIEVTGLEQFRSLGSENQKGIGRCEEINLYYIPGWAIRDKELMGFLSNRVRTLSNIQRVRKHKRLSQILGTSINQNKSYFILQYNQSQQQALSILKCGQLMKSAIFLHLNGSQRGEQLSQLVQFLGKERQELHVRENQAIVSKIRRIEQLIEQDQILKKMPTSLYQYLFSVDNYSRFIKIIIDTYFERKYEIKSNLNQAELTFLKLQQLTDEYKSARAKNTQLKSLLSECKRKIAALSDNSSSLQQSLGKLLTNNHYNRLLHRREKLTQFQQTRQKMIDRQKQLLQSIDNYKAIPRMQIANVKSLFNNNQSAGKQLFESLALLIADSLDPTIIRKTILDINLNMKIKQINFRQKKEDTMALVQERLSIGSEQEEFKVCNNLIHWLRHSIQYYYFRKEFAETEDEMSKKYQGLEELQALEVESTIKKTKLEIEETAEKLDKEKKQCENLDHLFKQSQHTLKGLAKFGEIIAFKQECERDQNILQQQYRLTLESAIYFSLYLNFILPSELQQTNSGDLIRGRQKSESYQLIIQRIFIRWVTQTERNISVDYFQRAAHKIFENKSRYEFIDKQVEASGGNPVIAKCKKIGNYKIAYQNQLENPNVQIFFPHGIYNKMLYLKYLLGIRYNRNNILLLDSSENLPRYLTLPQPLRLVRRTPRHQTPADIPPLIAYLLRPNDSAFLGSNHSLLFIELTPQAQQVTLIENSPGNYNIKVNSWQFIIPPFENLRVVYYCKQLPRDIGFYSQFYCIKFTESTEDVIQIVNNQILRHQLEFFTGSNSLYSCVKQASQTVVSEANLKRLVSERKKYRTNHFLENQERQKRLHIIEKCLSTQGNEKLSLLNSAAIQKVISLAEQWRFVYRQWTQSIQALSALKTYTNRTITPHVQKIISLYRLSTETQQRLSKRQKKILGSVQSNYIHFSLTFFLKIIRLIMKSIFSKDCTLSIDKHLVELQHAMLQYLCGHPLHRDAFALVLFLKAHCPKSDIASNFEVLNLFHPLKYQGLVQGIIEGKFDNFAQAEHLELPVYRLQIQKLLKSFKELLVDRPQTKQILRGKNLLLNPYDIVDLIDKFEYKLIKKEGDSAESFKKLTLFTQLLILKWITPSMMVDKCWKEMQQWRPLSTFSFNLKVYFFFTDIKFWSVWLESLCLQKVVFLRIYDNYQGSMQKLKKIAPKKGLLLIIDERDFSNEQKIELIARQRMAQFINSQLNCQLLILQSDRLHTIFHQVMRAMMKSPQTQIKAHCIESYHFFGMLDHYENLANKNACIQSAREQNDEYDERWMKIEDKFLAGHSVQINKILLRPILSNLKQKSNGDTLPLKLFIKKILVQFSIWQPFSDFKIDNIAPYYQDLSINPKFQRSQLIEILFPHEQSQSASKRVISLIQNVSKFKTSISNYLQNKFNIRFKEGQPQTIAKNKNKANNLIILDQIQFRFAVSNSDEVIQSSKQNFRNNERLARLRTLKSRKSSFSGLQQDFKFQSFLLQKSKQLISKIQYSLDNLLNLWKISQGEKPLLQHQNQLLSGQKHPHQTYDAMFLRKYHQIVRLFLQNQEIFALKESNKLQLIINNENLQFSLSQFPKSSLLELNYHCAGIRQIQVILRCYNSQSCHECSHLGRKGCREKACILLKNKLYELVIQGQVTGKQHQLPSILFHQLPGISPNIYCKKVLAELL